MSKYIIRNCNVIYFNLDKTAICNDLNLECPCECKERADCILKKIVELCRERSSKCESCKAYEDYQPTDCLQCSNDDVVFANDILKLFDIKECE